MLEHVARHDDELGADLRRERAQPGDRVAAGRRIAGLGITGEEVPRHAQLPVGGVQESHAGDPLSKCVFIRASRV
ncbi:hypothetical protein MOKP125_52010 [Mycobacterium avium subsp. hominissuis]